MGELLEVRRGLNTANGSIVNANHIVLFPRFVQIEQLLGTDGLLLWLVRRILQFSKQFGHKRTRIQPTRSRHETLGQ
jgi:hypothetical protein